MSLRKFLRHAGKIASSYEGTMKQSLHVWLANRWLSKNKDGAFKLIADKYEETGDPIRGSLTDAHYAISYIIRGKLIKPSDWDDERMMSLVVKFDDFHLVEEFLKHTPDDRRHQVVAAALDATQSAPWKIAGSLGKMGKRAEALLPSLTRLDECFSSYESFREAIDKIEGRAKKEEKSVADTCRHHFGWVTQPGLRCHVCSRPLSAQLISDARGKLCQKCGYVVHVECQG